MFIAVDVGNSHLSFSARVDDLRLETVSVAWSRERRVFIDPIGLEPVDIWEFLAASPLLRQLDREPANLRHDSKSMATFSWWIASVNKPASTALLQVLNDRRPQDSVCTIDHDMVPLADDLLNRQQTGIDRLLAAWFASQCLISSPTRHSGSGTIIVDVGSAVTVDWVDQAGVFRGGMIYPGFRLSATALHRETAALPLVTEVSGHPAPSAAGRGTIAAIEAGLFWSQWGGLCGAIAALQRVASEAPSNDARGSSMLASTPSVVVTGGGVHAFEKMLPPDWLWEPKLMPNAILKLAEVITNERRQ